MQIIIPLPQCSSANTYQELKAYLKQLELAVHHAQKAVESAEKEKVVLTEDAFINFNHPLLEMIDEKIEPDIIKDFGVNFYDELQNIEIKINLK